MNAKDTIKKVEETDSLEELETLREEEEKLDEPRKTVLAAIDERTTALSDSASDDDPDDTDEDEEDLPPAAASEDDTDEDEVSDDLGAGASDDWVREQQLKHAQAAGEDLTEADLVSDDEGHGPEAYRSEVPGNYSNGTLSPEGQLEHVKQAEKAEKTRNKIIQGITDKHDSVESLSTEEPFFDGGLRAAAEKSVNDVDAVDPTIPALNLEYVKNRAKAMLDGDTLYAQTGEGQVSSNSDDFAQRDSAARLAAEALRLESAATDVGRAEMGSQHERAAAHAEANAGEEGQGFVDPLLYPHYFSNADANVADRDEATAETDEDLEAQAQKILAKLDGEKAVVPESRRSSPMDPGDMPSALVPEDYPITAAAAEHPVVFSNPAHPAMGVFSMVSRQDYAHEEIGVITKTDLVNPTHPLVYVEFPNEDGGWFPPSNLRYEGDARSLVTAGDVGSEDEDD